MSFKVMLYNFLFFILAAFLVAKADADTYETWKDNQLRGLELQEVTSFAQKVHYFTNLFKVTKTEIEKTEGGKLIEEYKASVARK